MDANLDEYKTQLLTVEQALASTNNEEDKQELEALRSNLLELLELTNQTSADAAKQTRGDDDDMDTELKRFMREMNEIEKQTQSANDEQVSATDDEGDDNDVDIKLQELKSNLEEMIGHKCSAPHQHSWGAVTYHNAIVCGVEDNIEDDALDVRLRVLFTNPTHREMLPCSYYLDGDCRFDASQCHYSHGELVAVDDLREYSEPDFARLARNCVVLAKLQDRLWHRGRVLCANFVEKICRVRLEGRSEKEREKDFAFEDLFPIFHDEDLSSGSSSDSNEESDSEELDELEAAKRAQLIEQSLFEFKPTQALGEWEKYTRGIGSKLMAKMGYIHGTGLGSDGRGIVTPVSAQILPQGCSLDRCMELREAAYGDKNFFSVEKKLRREQQKQESINAKAYEREAKRVDVFTFLNDSVFKDTASSRQPSGSSKKDKPALHQQTTKSLNVESVRLADEIRRKEREIAQVSESMRRNEKNAEMQKRLQSQLEVRKQELDSLQREEKILSREQATRKTKDKLTVF